MTATTERPKSAAASMSHLVESLLDGTPKLRDDDGMAFALTNAALGAGSLGRDAQNLLERIEGHAASVPVGPARARIFASLSIAFARASDAQRAIKATNRAMNTAERIEDLALRAEAITQIAGILADGGLRAECNEALERALSVAQSIEDGDQRDRALLVIAAACARTGRAEHGLAALGRDTKVEVKVVAAPAPAPQATPAPQAKRPEPVEELDEIEELAEVEEIEEIEEIVEAAPAPKAAAPTSKAPAPAEDTAPAPKKYDIPLKIVEDVEWVDPAAGKKFPARGKTRRR